MAIDPSLTGLPEDDLLDGTELVEVINRDGRKVVPVSRLATGGGGPSIGGPLPNGAWVTVPSIYRLRLTGTGTVTIDARNSVGSVTSNVARFTPGGATNQIEYPYFGDDTVAVRAALTGTATAEVI